ncbi:unnamed protein product [Notodromas monacha]|uniref:Vitellogenin n=1 Tax=Notodromas monacha TaxID=399045 RepID=A0A7R9BL06_9CRUS|nr:unnamed protein product [Notodromas monacha]CAG0917423.1 unnamed protein product [Notodromas monacha]
MTNNENLQMEIREWRGLRLASEEHQKPGPRRYGNWGFWAPSHPFLLDQTLEPVPMTTVASGLSTTEVWPAGKEFIYDYHTRVIAGMPMIKEQLTGFGLKCIARLQVVSPDTILVKLTKWESGKINHEVPQARPLVYRAKAPMDWSPVQGEVENLLSEAFKVKLRNGLVTSLEVEEHEPTWCVNIKKGFASQININLKQTNKIPFQLTNTKRWEDKSFRHMNIPSAERTFFAVEEDSMGGKCKTAYVVAPIENYVAVSEEWDLPRHILLEAASEPEARPWLVTKIRDFDECERRPSWVHMNMKDITNEPCNPANAMCHKFSTPLGIKTERMWTVSNQTLTLLSERPITSRIELRHEKLTSTHLRFEFPVVDQETRENPRLNEDPAFAGLRLPREQTIRANKDKVAERKYSKINYERREHSRPSFSEPGQYGSREADWQQRRPMNSYERSHMKYGSRVGQSSEEDEERQGSGYGSKRLMKRQVTMEKKNTRADEGVLDGSHNFGLHKLSLDVGSSSSSEESQDEMRNWDNQYSPRGPHQGERYFETQVMKSAYSRDLRMYYPTLKVPSAWMCPQTSSKIIRSSAVKGQIIELLREVVSEISNFEDLAEKESALKILQCARAFSILSYGEIAEVYEKIVSSSTSPVNARTKKTLCLDALVMSGTHPAIMFVIDLIKKGEVKGETAAQALSTIPISVKAITPELLAEMVMVIIHALGNTGHPGIIPVLEACITGQICKDTQVRTKAVNALSRAARVAPSKVYKLLRPIYANQKMHYAVRMAAFQVLLKCEPSPVFFTAVATDTWFEPSQQVGSFVYTTLAALANNTVPVYQNASRMAEMALPLCKKYELGAQYSRKIILSNFVPEKSMGSFLQNVIFGSTKSFIPRLWYTRLIKRAGGFNWDMLQTGFYAQGVQEIVNKITRVLSPVSSSDELFSLMDRVSGAWNRGEEPLSAISRELNLKLRKDDPMSVMAWVKAFGGMERVVTANYRTLWELVNDVKPHFTSSGVGVKWNINYQRAINPESMTVVLPTASGIPMYFSKKTPVLVSIRGHIEVEADLPNLSQKRLPEAGKIKIDLRPVISQNTLLEMGIVCPITDKNYIAGVNTHNLASLPFKATLKINVPEKQLKFEIEPSSGPLPGVISLAHSHQRPFTCVKNLEDFSPINKVSSVRWMRNVTIIGEEMLGIPIRILSKVDHPFSDMLGSYWRLKRQNLVSALLFSTSPRSLRNFQTRVTVDTSRCQTKKIEGKITISTSESSSPVWSLDEESSSESKYYSGKSEHWSRTQEDLISFFRNPSKYWEESEELQYTPMIGSSGEWVRKRFATERYAEDYSGEKSLEVNVKSGSKVTMVHGEIKMEGPVPRYIRASVLASSNSDDTFRKISAHIEKEGGMQDKSWKAFVNGMIQYPQLPNTPHREALVKSDMTSLGCLTVRFGRNTEHAIKAKVIMARTGKQRYLAEESQAAKRCDSDEAKGLMYSSSCMRARQQATTLNKYIVDVEGENLPRGLWNMTWAMDNYLKWSLYPYMTVDPTARHKNPEGSIRAIINVATPNPDHPYTVVDLLTKKPHENAFFKTIKLPWAVEAMFPLNAKTPWITKALNEVLGYKFTPMCRVGHDSIQTFDNVTIPYSLPDCYHLIAKDCSRPSGIAVLAKQGPELTKVVKLIVGDKEVVLVPTRSSSPTRPNLIVKINGNELTPMPENAPHEIKEQGQVVIRINKRSDGEVSVECPSRGLQVTSDGHNIRVQASAMLRGRMCGLCGDYNGEKDAELKGPRGCVHLSPISFGRSYAVHSEGCSSLPQLKPVEYLKNWKHWKNSEYEQISEHDITALASRHMQSCNSEDYWPEGETFNPHRESKWASELMEDAFSSGKEWRRVRKVIDSAAGLGMDQSSPCVRHITKVIVRGDQTCFSVKPVPECNLSCRPNKVISKKIGFRCIMNSDVNEKLLAAARFSVLREFLDQQPHFINEIPFPHACEMYSP